MRSNTLLALLLACAPAALAQSPAPAKPAAPPKPAAPAAVPTPPPVEGYVITAEITALAPEMKATRQAPSEATALTEKLRQSTKLQSRFYLSRDMSRQEILSTDFILPAGTLVMHAAGDRFYVMADPQQKTYVVMDAAQLLAALEGGAGIVNTEYQAKAVHTEEKKLIAGFPCRKSIVTVTYVSSIPFENSQVLVQQQNDVEIWHTSEFVSSAAMDHLFFKFQKDRTGTVRKEISEEIGFPMDVKFTVTQAGGGKKAGTVQPGSFHYQVTEAKVERKMDSEMFRIPPAGFRRLDKNPYFKDVAAPAGN